jgi:hypothetical protein
VALADEILTLPVDPAFSSLNIAQAVFYEILQLSGQGLLAWTLPEAAWQPLARLFGRFDAAMKPGRTHRHTARIAATLNLPNEDARRFAIETRANGYLERFQCLRSWRFDGWSPAIDVLGEQHVAEAQAKGAGTRHRGPLPRRTHNSQRESYTSRLRLYP